MEPIESLQQFIKILENENELVRIKAPVSSDLEISEIYFRHARSPGGGKALLFEHVEGSELPVLINAFGSFRRMKLAFGNRNADEIAEGIADYVKLIHMKSPRGLSDLFSLAGKAKRLLKFPPKKYRKSNPPVHEVIYRGDDVDLDRLPILKSWPLDGGNFITMGLTLTRSLNGDSKNLGMYRLQQINKNALAMHWQVHKDGSHFFQEYRKANKRMPVSVIIGADPAVVFSATAPLPPNVYELLLAGLIRQKGVFVVQGITNDLPVPAHAEIVLEGYVDPEERFDEGPFGDHTGYYTPVEPFPVFHVEAITMRKNAVYHATVVGRSPQEDCYLAHATERLFLPLLQVVAPEVKDQMLPWDGNFHNCAVFSIEKQFPYHGRRLMNHLWGFSQMSFAKSIVVVDESENLHTGETLLRSILDSIHITDDVYITQGVLDQLDHSGLRPLYGGKFGLDATGKLPEERNLGEVPRSQAKVVERSSSGSNKRKHPPGKAKITEEKKLDAFYKRIRKKLGSEKISVVDAFLYGPELKNPVLIVSVKKKKGEGALSARFEQALQIQKDPTFPASVVLIVDQPDDVRNGPLVLWRMFGNVDPIRDVVFAVNPDARDLDALILDATAKGKGDGVKRPWPLENRMDEKTIKRVTERWKELFGEEPFDVERP